jgi:hypothetical protein
MGVLETNSEKKNDENNVLNDGNMMKKESKDKNE